MGTITFILVKGKVKLREVKGFIQNHSVSNWHG